MGISSPAAFIVAQVQRDMPQVGTGTVGAAVLANAAGIGVEALHDSLAEALAELTLRLPDSQFSVVVQGDCVVFERKPAVLGLIEFMPVGSPVPDPIATISKEAVEDIASRMIASIVPQDARQDVTGRRKLISVLSRRPAHEVEAILGTALWMRKQQGIKFWAAAMKRLKEATDDEAWQRRLAEAEDCMAEQEDKVNFHAMLLAKVSEAEMVEGSIAAGLLPRRVRDAIEKRKLEKVAQKQEGK